MSVDVCWCLECVKVCGGVSGGYLGDILACLRCSNTFRGVSQSSILMKMSCKGAIILQRHDFEMHDFFHLTILRYQNIKMSICQLNKNGWV